MLNLSPNLRLRVQNVFVRRSGWYKNAFFVKTVIFLEECSRLEKKYETHFSIRNFLGLIQIFGEISCIFDQF